ncbi:ribosomal protein S18 acetylase RimI-like enzyme [Alkalibacillus filiformis]|uniref:Ribosomal protein S18 acetylase RimI-like enzyme n=1 Tax=Alkalibacillus filiformis TaxID=200990 RepID=A0ABU0DWZ2_9BACI|nr:GNAT family N-acetyltransferase [Alkalibacillus filiformis]MDQ0352957.1 ribosomal protein S18 acetylase RimI-like enzyme [Alkalibacillus filiformis]
MIREATHHDLDQIEQLVIEAKRVMKEAGMTQWGDTYPLRNHYETDIEKDELYVYEDQGEVLAVACISDQGHEEYEEINWSEQAPFLCIKRLAVKPAARHKGIALAFYRFAENLAANRGFCYIRTDTNGENKAAINLFYKGDYQLVDRQRHGNFTEPFYYFEKKIPVKD